MKYKIYDVIDNKYYLKNDSDTIIIVSKETLKKCFWRISLGVYVEKWNYVHF